MKKQKAILEQIENNRPITREQNGVFLAELQQALLLSLKETGMLNDIQYRNADKKLRRYSSKGAF